MQPYPPPQGYSQQGYAPGPPPAPARRSALPWLLAGVSALCVVLLVAGGIWWWQSHKSDGDSGPVPGQLTKEFPTAPSAAWTVRPSDVGGTKFFSTNFTSAQYGSAGGATDGRFVVTGVEVGGRSTVVGIDANGRTWVPDESLTCADQVVIGRTACRLSQSDDSRIFFLDLAGRSVSSGVSATDREFGMVSYNGEAAFRTSAQSIMRVNAERVEWSRPASMSPPPGGDYHAALATRELVSFYYGGGTYVASAHDGRVLLTNVLGRPVATPDGGMLISGTSGSESVAVRPDGAVVKLSGTAGAPDVAGPGFEHSLLVDGHLYGPDGGKSWTTPTNLPNNRSRTSFPLVSTRLSVVQGDAGYHGVDTATGRLRWTSTVAPSGVGSWGGTSALTDGRYLIHPSAKGSIVGIDLESGREAWSIPSPLGGDQVIGSLLAVGDTFVVVGKDRVVGYRATGGPAHAPGASTGATTNSSGGDQYYTRCGSKPVFTPQRFRTESGGLVVTMKITATCPGGDALTSAGTAVTISDSTGVIASGTFDFATNSIGVPKPGSDPAGQMAGTTVDLLFKQGQFFRTPDTLPPAGAGNGSSGAGGLGGHSYRVDCVQPDAGAGRAKVPSPSNGPIGSTGPGPQSGLNPMSGLSALRIQANSDKAFILAKLDNHWVAQLSSKRVGLVADGRAWDEKAILDEFLALRLRFADVRLLYSDEWSVFDYRGWWVTVAAATFPDPDAANGWCRTNGFDREHCFAKLVSTSAGPDGSTRYW